MMHLDKSVGANAIFLNENKKAAYVCNALFAKG